MEFITKDLSYSIGGVPILQDISLSFRENAFTTILGPNGSGKSTLLSFLSGLRTSAGHVFLEGRDIAGIPRLEYARQVSMLSQEHASLPDFSVAHAVLMGRFPYKKPYGDYTKEDERIAHESMEEAGIPHLAGRTLKSLSGGEFQRVRIARVLAQRTPIMLFDEPTNHLDVKHKVFLLQRLRALRRTTICVLHDISLAAQYADAVAILKGGRCIAFGRTADILEEALLEKVFEVPFLRFERDGKTYWNY